MSFSPFIYKIDEFCGHNKRWIVFREYEPTAEYGTSPDKRDIRSLINTSIVNVDKPPGPTSHEVAFWVKTMFNLNRVGHGGTLEPELAGQSQGYRGSTHWVGESHKGNESSHKIFEGVYVSDGGAL
ncbi:tRNA pseudouridine synthase A [Metallosphaera tengchongensis]|uniref:tRNA pseudouridine synthase A n=1 Tax=Metallosphaera tengchongensis TaxID=1532350 RepID=A0A6N0NUI2_9CREN|nr:tRNA pseudouridine synthase A [Metallosphaera tengchongensis]QKQ99814.1 tRNA pseudouridine synthase A [Metallosphaera tengchongensis]